MSKGNRHPMLKNLFIQGGRGGTQVCATTFLMAVQFVIACVICLFAAILYFFGFNDYTHSSSTVVIVNAPETFREYSVKNPYAGITLYEESDAPYDFMMMSDFMHEHAAGVVVVFPEDFDDEITSGITASVLSYYRTDTLSYKDIRDDYVDGYLEGYKAFLAETYDLDTGSSAWAIIRDDIPTNGDMSRGDLIAKALGENFIPILLFITLLYASMAVGTEAISGQKERGTFSRILLTPMSRQNIVIAFTRGVFIRALIPALLIIIITFFIPPYSYSLAGFLPSVLMIVSLALFISALAVMISVMNDSVTSAQTAFLPVFFILVTVAVTCINGENRDSPAYGFIPVYGQFFGIGDAVNGNPDTVRAFVCSLLTILLAVLVVWISGRLLMTERFTVSIGSSEEGSVSTSKADKILDTLFGLLDVVFFPLMILSVYQFLAMIPVAAAYMRDPDYSGFIEDLSNVSGVADIVDKTMEILGIFMNDPRFLALMAVSYILIIVSCIRKAKGPANIGLTSQRLIPGYLTGIVLGSVMMSLVFGLLVMTGKASVRGTGFPSGQTLTFIFSILMWIPQGAAEEVMFRGYMMTRLKKLFSGRPRLGTFIGIFVSSVLFSVFHCFNGGFDVIALINIFLLAVLFALIYEKSGSIVITCAAHTMWNMLQGNFYGLSVSGNAAVPSILNVNYTGSTFGPEGTIETTAVVTIGIILFAVISLCRRASSRKT